MITGLIIDDEKSGRETLAFLLEKHFPDRVKLLGSGNSVKEGVTLVQKLNPQLVFLDMEMPNEVGLGLVEQLPDAEFEVIVTTAHREYGIDALKAGVADYLLKPIDIDELDKALKKVSEKIFEKKEVERLKHLELSGKKIPLVMGNNKTEFIELGSIIRCEADGNYTRIVFAGGRSELVTRLIKEMEVLLAEGNFYRVHKSHLINVDHVKAYRRSDDDITMSDGSFVPLSRNIKPEFLKKMGL